LLEIEIQAERLILIEQYLLDTCVVSEYVRKQPEMKVIQWLDLQLEEDLFISAITIGEIKKGIVKIESSQPKKCQKLNEWLGRLMERFETRTIALDRKILIEWGVICGNFEKSGRKMPVIDSLIAATAITNQLTLVTRNENDFDGIDVPIFNPWN
jgi:predicted nucleic acid-binding protein